MPPSYNADLSDPLCIAVDSAEQFTVLEQLPRPLRELIWHAPVNMDCREVEAVARQYGTASAVELIERVLDEQYPGRARG